MSKPKLKEPLIILVGAVILIMWLVNAMNTGNPWWFLPFQPNYQPSRIVIRDYGTAVTITPDMPEYTTLSAAFDLAFSDFSNTSLISLGLSDETLRRYNEEELVIEIYYPEYITFNTQVRMSKVNQLLIPVEGTHAGQGYLFLGSNGMWRIGPMVMANEQPIYDAMRELGYLQN